MKISSAQKLGLLTSGIIGLQVIYSSCSLVISPHVIMGTPVNLLEYWKNWNHWSTWREFFQLIFLDYTLWMMVSFAVGLFVVPATEALSKVKFHYAFCLCLILYPVLLRPSITYFLSSRPFVLFQNDNAKGWSYHVPGIMAWCDWPFMVGISLAFGALLMVNLVVFWFLFKS